MTLIRWWTFIKNEKVLFPKTATAVNHVYVKVSTLNSSMFTSKNTDLENDNIS
jgi:hypothetical protein